MAEGKIREMSQASLTAQSPSASPGQDLLLRLIPLKSGSQVLGVLCLRIERGVSRFANEQGMLEEVDQPDDQAAFFWTFLDLAIMKIERAQLLARAVANGG